MMASIDFTLHNEMMPREVKFRFAPYNIDFLATLFCLSIVFPLLPVIHSIIVYFISFFGARHCARYTKVYKILFLF